MTFHELQVRTEALVKLGGWSNAQPAPDYASLVNEGLRNFTRETQHNIEDKTVTTVASQATYLLGDTPQWIAFFDDALYNGTIWISQTSIDELRSKDRLWRMRPAGVPVWWYWAGPQKIGFFPVPSLSAVNVTFEGARHEPELANDTDVPLVDKDFHEGICLFAAWYFGKLYSRGEERGVAAGYRSEALDYAARYRQTLDAKEASLVVRRVQRAPQEYLGSGAKQFPIYWPQG